MAPLQDTPSLKITYSARVTSVLPVLMSALRVSPPAQDVHGGKEVGKDEITYEYNQVKCFTSLNLFPISLWGLLIPYFYFALSSLACRNPVVYHRHRVREHYLQTFLSCICPRCPAGPVEIRRVDGAGGDGFSVLGIREGYSYVRPCSTPFPSICLGYL